MLGPANNKLVLIGDLGLANFPILDVVKAVGGSIEAAVAKAIDCAVGQI